MAALIYKDHVSRWVVWGSVPGWHLSSLCQEASVDRSLARGSHP
ncbi:hypothetical protein [Myxococcus stipitatus]